MKRLFFRKLTFRRVINIIKVYFSYLLSIVFKTTVRFGFPVSLSIEPTGVCNLRCPECPSGLRQISRKEKYIKLDLYKKVIDEAAPYLASLILYFQGEPYLHPEFTDLVKYASLEKKVYTITSTNAHFLTEERAKSTVLSGLDKLIISIDGTTQATYEQYRKSGNLEKVKEGLKNIVEQKAKLKSETPEVAVQFLVVKPNEHQIEAIKQLAKEYGADAVILKSAQLYDYKNGHPLMTSFDKYSRYKKNPDGTYKIKNKLKSRCSRLWNSSVITTDGELLPCCFDKDAKYTVGNILEENLSQLNNNAQAKAFRKKLLSGRKNIDICKNCTEGLRL